MNTKNFYYDPEACGLRIVGAVDRAPQYEFDIFLVLADTEGNLYYVMDSGCSCPLPFENMDLSDTTPGTRQEIHDALEEWGGNDYDLLHGDVASLHWVIAEWKNDAQSS